MRRLVLIALFSAGCASTGTAPSSAPAPVPAPGGVVVPAPPAAPAPVAISEVGYREEFGRMWTFDSPPLEYWRKTYNFSPDQAWLDRVRRSSLRLPGCSGSFVSGNGLMMTNHHCVRDCIFESSTPENDAIANGFIARRREDEKKCADMTVDLLESIENVTQRVQSAVTATDPAEQATQRTAITNQIQNECAQRTGLTCQVVSLYAGGAYSLYTYRRFDDVRLVWAPEEIVAYFGGDPDNFTYPRYDLDAALLRVYVNGQPHKPTDYFRWSRAGAVEDDLVFVVGNPGSTGRLNTIAQMEFLRDVQYPAALATYQRYLDVISEAGRRDPELAKEYQGIALNLENARKAVTGYRTGLLDSAAMRRKSEFERELRARFAADPQLAARFGGVHQAIADAQAQLAAIAVKQRYHSFGPALGAGGSRLLNLAGQLVRMTDQTKAAITRDQRVDSLYERLVLTAHLKAAQAELPANDPFLVAALGGRTPEQAAAALVSGSRIGDVAFRKQLVDGGAAAIAASNDPMLVLARAIDPLNRAVQAQAAGPNAVIATNASLLGRALFDTYGTALPPDATFTLRISDGLVSGYPMNGTLAPYKTTYMGMYARSADFDGKPPFDLPKRWIDRMNRLDLTTPYNMASTNDNIGGNSGSPVINRAGEIVGLIFDGNIENVANRFYFSTDRSRSVSVHSMAIPEALRKMFDAPALADELTAGR
jgi:hypothetical protein